MSIEDIAAVFRRPRPASG